MSEHDTRGSGFVGRSMTNEERNEVDEFVKQKFSMSDNTKPTNKPQRDYIPAFPVDGQQIRTGYEGMQLRDYFAAQALNGIVSGIENTPHYIICATWAYELADAMMKRRNENLETNL